MDNHERTEDADSVRYRRTFRNIWVGIFLLTVGFTLSSTGFYLQEKSLRGQRYSTLYKSCLLREQVKSDDRLILRSFGVDPDDLPVAQNRKKVLAPLGPVADAACRKQTKGILND